MFGVPGMFKFGSNKYMKYQCFFCLFGNNKTITIKDF